MRGNRLQRLPAFLSSCTQLTALLLSGNGGLRLEPHPLLSRRTRSRVNTSVLSVLASLPALKRVELPSCASEAVKAELAAAAPHIQQISIAPMHNPCSGSSTADGDSSDGEE